MEKMNNRSSRFAHWQIKQSARISSTVKQIRENNTFGPQTIWDYLGYSGAVLLSLMLIQAITGLLLVFYYYPHPVKAFSSLVAIKNDIPYGMLFSNIHTIGAKLIVLVAFIHMFRIMLITGFRGPRSPQWYTGLGLLTFLMVTGFSGYLLPWSQQSYWACVIGTEAVRSVPVVGDMVAEILRGGEDISGATLTRFYIFHILFLPITIAILIWYHIKQVWRTGVIGSPTMHAYNDSSDCKGCGICEKTCSFDAIKMGVGSEDKLPLFDDQKCNACRECMKACPENCIDLKSDTAHVIKEPIFPNGMLHRMMAILATLTLLFFSVYFMHNLIIAEKIPAAPLITPDHIKPDWYFLGPYQVLKVMPSEFTGLVVLFAIYLVLFLLPTIDRKGPRDPSKRTVYSFWVKTGILLFIIFTIWGWLS